MTQRAKLDGLRPDITHEVRQKAVCRGCGVRGDNTYQVVEGCVLIIGLTRAANLIIGLKPVEPLALIEEARARVKNHV